jgi:hypothetical protein
MDSTDQSLKETATVQSEGSDWVVPNILAMEVVDYSEYYTVYGILTLIVIMLLLWYFVRSTSYDVTHDSQMKRFHLPTQPHPHLPTHPHVSKLPSKHQSSQSNPTSQFTDANYKLGPLQKGMYGGVVVYFNETSDNMFASDWRTPNGGLYVHNARTFWKDANTPNEAEYWAWEADQFLMNNK